MRFLRLDLPGMPVLIGYCFSQARNASVSYPLSATSPAMPGIRLAHVSATVQSAVLPGVSTNTQGPALFVDNRVYLAVSAALGDAYRLRLGHPFPPPAQ